MGGINVLQMVGLYNCVAHVSVKACEWWYFHLILTYYPTTQGKFHVLVIYSNLIDLIWLVVWIMNFIFPYIGNFIIPSHIFLCIYIYISHITLSLVICSNISIFKAAKFLVNLGSATTWGWLVYDHDKPWGPISIRISPPIINKMGI